MSEILTIIGWVFIAFGALLCAIAAIGLIRLPDALERLHAASKPQTLGILLLVVGLGAVLQNLAAIGILLLSSVALLLTATVAGHMISRTAYRTGNYEKETLVLDEPTNEQPWV